MISRRAFLLCLLVGGLAAGCTPRRPASSPYLALGDSYTIGEGVPAPQSFPHLLARRHGWPAPVVVAKTGWTSHALLEEVRDLEGTHRLVTLLIGANDVFRGRTQQRYEQDLAALLTIAIARAGGISRNVLVVAIPDFSVVPALRGRSEVAATILRFNAAAKTIAEARGAQWVNIVPASRRMAEDPSLVAADGLHPSRKMHEQWAALIGARVAPP